MRMVYVGKEHILTVSEESQPEMHKHFFKHIVISYGKPLQFKVNEEEILANGIVINSNVLHTICCTEQKHMVFLIEETSYLAQQIDDQFLKGNAWSKLPQELVEKIQEKKFFYIPVTQKEGYEKEFEDCMISLGLIPLIKTKMDERIVKVLDYLKNLPMIESHLMSDLMVKTHLSQSRLSHLFKAEVHISLSSYLTLVKTGKAYEYLFEGANITEAAMKAGFSSSNHFASTSKNLWGFSPSSLDKESICFNFLVG